MNFFRASKPKETPKDAIQKISEAASLLEKRESHLQAKVDQELEIAKKYANTNKTAALAALKRKKRYVEEIDSISAMRLNLETQRMTIESAQSTTEVMGVLKYGAATLKNMHQATNIDKVDATMDDIREQMDLAKEVSDAITQPIGMGGVDMDEDELESELGMIQETQIDIKMNEFVSAPVRPVAQKISADEAALQELQSLAVPTGIPLQQNRPVAAGPSKPADEDEDELAMLKASMAMGG